MKRGADSTMGKKIVMLSTSMDSAGGIAAVVSVYRDENLFKDCSIEHISTHVYGSKARKLYTLITALFRFLFLLISDSVAAVHAHTASRSSFWRKFIFFYIARIFRKPYLFHLHGGGFNKFYWHESGIVTRSMIKYVLDRSHTIIVLSQRWKIDISKITSNRNVLVVYNPVFLPELSNDVKIEHSILYLGFIDKQKGIYDLLLAMKKVFSQYPDIKLLAGGTGEVEKVKVLVDELGLNNNVKFLGWIEGDEKGGYLSQAQLFILVSYYEGLPMSLLEAMSYELPVITTPVGGIPEVVDDGLEGFIVQPGDVEAIAEALTKLLSSTELRKRMGKAGRKRIESGYTPSVVFPVLKSIYKKINPNLVKEV